MRRRLLILVACLSVAAGGYGLTAALGIGETSGTVTAVATACADASVPDVAYSDGAARTGTIAGASDHQCRTATAVETYTVPTVTETVTTTAPPPPPPPVGDVLASKTWEDGLENSQGFAQQCENIADVAGLHRGTLTTDTSTSDTGSVSGKFVLPTYTGGRTACELLYSRHPNRGTDEYYAQSFKFGDFEWGDCQNQSLSLSQLNYQGISGMPLGLSGQCGKGLGAAFQPLPSLYVLVNSGNCDSGSCPFYSGTPVGGGYSSRGMPTPGPYYLVQPGDVQTGVWYQTVLHVRWTDALDGVIEGWIKKKGEPTFVRKFSYSGGFPTLQWGKGWSFPANDGSTTNDKIGAYRGPDAAPTTIWQDSFCRATTFEAAAACEGS